MITHIQLNITGGSTIDQAIDEAIGHCSNASVVSFSFNGVHIAMTKEDTRQEILKYWERAMFSDKWYKN